MRVELTKIDAAVDQLDWAIRLLLDHRAYLAAITLAGAAEEILGKCVQGASAHSQLKDKFLTEFEMEGDTPSERAKTLNARHLNKARNWLKHSDIGDPMETASMELEAEATQYIARGLANLLSVDRSLPSQGPRFLIWVRENHGDYQ